MNPLEFDDLYYNDKTELRRLARDERPHLRARVAHASLNSHRDPAHALRLLGDYGGPPAQGVRLLCYIEQGDYKRVLETGYTPRGTDPLELEEAVYCEWALSMAAFQLGEPEQALRRIDRAIFVAGLLGMNGRVRVMNNELDRQRSQQADVPFFGLKFMEPTEAATPEGKQKRDVYLIQLLGQGHYDLAYQEAKRLEADPEDIRRSAALAMIDETPMPAGSPYENLAHAFDLLRRGEALPYTPEAENAPWAGYAAFAQVAALVTAGETNLPPLMLPFGGAPDQRVMLAAYRWARWLRSGESDVEPLTIPELIRSGLYKLDAPVGPASWLVRVMPDEMEVLVEAGLAHEAVVSALSKAVRLDYMAVMVGAKRVRFNMRASEAMLKDGLAGEKMLTQAISGYDKHRYLKKLEQVGAEHKPMVNPARVYRHAKAFDLHAQQRGLLEHQLASEQALRTAYRQLPSFVKNLTT